MILKELKRKKGTNNRRFERSIRKPQLIFLLPILSDKLYGVIFGINSIKPAQARGVKNGLKEKNCKKYRSCARETIARRIRTEIPDKLSKDTRREKTKGKGESYLCVSAFSQIGHFLLAAPSR